MDNLMSPSVRWAVAEVMEREEITPRELKVKANITYNQALALRRGVYERIDLNTLARVCVALNTTPGDLLVLVPDNSPI